MRVSADSAFKEWAVVVDTLARGEQILILRKGGIREHRGEFHVDHPAFWLFPTQYHEAERSIIPSKRPALRELAANAPADAVDIQYYAVADPVLSITDAATLERLQGRHIWTESVLRQRFDFGRGAGLHALIVRVYQLPDPERLPMRERYRGCKSWVQLERPIAGDVAPVLDDAEFARQRDELIERIREHACADL
jgi:hypothetical protein